MSISLHAGQIIAGEVSRAGSNTFTAVNPRTRTAGTLEFPNATAQEIDRAVQAAQTAYATTRNYSAAQLAGFLEHVAAEIEALGDQLLTVADEETGLGLPRLTGERSRTTGQLRKFAALLREGSYVEAIIDSAQPDRTPAPRPTIRRMLVPLGPVAVFSASNFPFAFAVAGGDSASAWAAGCPVIVKAHPSHPATSELFAHAVNRAIAKAGFPAGFFSLIQGDTIDVGQTLVQHPGITAVGFTGSLRAGRAIYDAAAARPVPIPVYAEMGSVNPMVILPGALQERPDALASGFVTSVTLGAGQFCTNPGLAFLIDGPATAAFVDAVTAQMAANQPGVLLNTNIQTGLAHVVASTIEQSGVEKLTGGEIVQSSAVCYANTVLKTDSATFRQNAHLQEEHFGPVTLCVICASAEDLQDTLAVLGGNLTATIHAGESDLPLAGELVNQLRETVGRLIWNGFPTGVEVVHSMQHGGPYPATTAPGTTSVGMTAIKRFMRPVAFQDIPDALLPAALQDANPLGIWRVVDEQLTRDTVS